MISQFVCNVGVSTSHTTSSRLNDLFFWCAPSYGAPARSRERRAARMVTLSRAPACRCREMVACMCRQTDSLPVGIGRVQLPPGLADGVGGRAAKRRLCAVHTAHKRTPPVATFASERAEVKKSLFIFDERQRKLLRHRTAPAREPWGALGMVGMWAVAARRGT